MGSKRNAKDVIGLGTQRSTNTAFAGNSQAIQPTTAVTQAPEERFVVGLVNLDAAAVACLKKGQSVFLNLGFKPIEVKTLQGRRIGDVSDTDAERVLQHGASGGVVVNYSAKEPLSVAVRVG